ncbi:MAG: Porphobilinogen synthase [Bacteriovoracaceae bacterium]|nr:Porphobilinogen synthase [Bacteriovoracaceae bacterium]
MAIQRHRPRRLRANSTIRRMVQETTISPSKLCLPLFVCDGKNIQSQHKSVPGILTFSVDRLIKYLKEIETLSIPAILLFGVAKKKDARGSEALNKNAPVVRAISEVRSKFPDLIIGTDIALDPYTDHGHDGLFDGKKILNDETVEVLTEMSLLHAKAGAHILAPSDMMDGRVLAIREALEENGFEDRSILAYTAKYASCLYGPFRDTLSSKVVGDKKAYQMDPANRREALRELKLDLEEGADMVMVKPASWYLDIISDFKRESHAPIAAYQVSGECAMIEIGAKNGLFDRNRAILESATSIFRSGADLLVSYFAIDIAQLLRRHL